MGGEGSGDLLGHEFRGNQWTSGGIPPITVDHINQFKKINALNRQDKERLFAYKNGKAVTVSVVGTKDSVTIPPGSLKNCDIVHNHTNDNPAFSPEDIYLSAGGNVNSVSAVSVSNGTWTVLRPPNGWGDIDHNKVETAFKTAVAIEKSSSITKEIIRKYRLKEITIEEGDKIFNQNISRRALKDLGLVVEELP